MAVCFQSICRATVAFAWAAVLRIRTNLAVVWFHCRARGTRHATPLETPAQFCHHFRSSLVIRAACVARRGNERTRTCSKRIRRRVATARASHLLAMCLSLPPSRRRPRLNHGPTRLRHGVHRRGGGRRRLHVRGCLNTSRRFTRGRCHGHFRRYVYRRCRCRRVGQYSCRRRYERVMFGRRDGVATRQRLWQPVENMVFRFHGTDRDMRPLHVFDKTDNWWGTASQ